MAVELLLQVLSYNSIPDNTVCCKSKISALSSSHMSSSSNCGVWRNYLRDEVAFVSASCHHVSLLLFLFLILYCTLLLYLYAVACKDNSQAACCLLTLYSVEVVTCSDEM